MFVFLLVIALLVLIALIVFMMIELNAVEDDSAAFITRMKRRYGEE